MPPNNGVKVKLDRMRTLRLGMRGVLSLERELGLTLTEVGAAVQSGSITTIVTVVWAALLHEDPNLTVEDVADLMDHGKLTDIAQAAGQAMSEAFPAEDAVDEGKAETASKKKTGPKKEG